MRLYRKNLILVLGLFLAQGLFDSDSTFAQQPAKKEKKQTLNFEDELVEGASSKPELFFLFQKKNFNYNRLIKLRENFIPEMRRTSEDLQRSRREN